MSDARDRPATRLADLVLVSALLMLDVIGCSSSPPVEMSAGGAPGAPGGAGVSGDAEGGSPPGTGGVASATMAAGGIGGRNAGASVGGSSGHGGSAGRAAQADGGQPSDGASAFDAGSARLADAAADVNQTALPAVTLYLVGDSTVMDYGAASAQQGWGQQLSPLFISKVVIEDRAIGGRSVQSFMYTDASNTVETSTWMGIKSALRPGDYLMVQFGANDSSGIAGRAVTPADFGTLLGTMVAEVEAKHATPILVTPSALQQWVNGKETNTRLGPYADAMRVLGASKNVAVDDLNARSVELLNVVGQTAAEKIYINGDKAHFTEYGATQMAILVAGELRRIASPLAAYLK